MTSDVSAPRLTLRTPYDVAGAVPHLLGFTPANSLVAICLQARQVRLTLRVDLPRRGDERAFVEDLVARIVQAGVGEVLLVCFTDRSATSVAALPRSGLLRRTSSALLEAGLLHRESLLVARGRWWSYTCPLPQCCPRTGTPLPESTAALSTLSAERVLSGRSVFASRDELAATIEAAEDLPTDVTPAGPAVAPAVLLALAARLREGGTTADVPARDRAAVALGLADVVWRDEVLSWLATLQLTDAVALMSDLSRQVPDDRAAPVCAVLAWIAYAAGDGGLANMAVDRALRAEPGYSLALLVNETIARQVEPEVLRRAGAQLPHEPWPEER